MEVSVLWFVAALLAFSLAYAALRRVRPASAPRAGVLAAAAAVIAVSSFAVWQVWSANAGGLLDLRVGQWPQGAVLFTLGVLGAEAGWLDGFPPVLARRLGWVAAARVAALVALMVSLVLARGADQAGVEGADLPTMAFALLDGVIAVSGTLWFLSWLRRRWPTRGILLGQGRTRVLRHICHPPAGVHRGHGRLRCRGAGPRNQVPAGRPSGGGCLLHGRVRADPGAGHP
jgi:hypothetical protein